jgi:hypothetical protein
MTNRLKIIAFSACCFIAALSSNALGDPLESDDCDSKTIHRSTTTEIDPLESKLKQPQLLADSKQSWRSYLLSPVKATLNCGYEFIKLANNNPKAAVMVGLTLTAQVIAAQQHFFICFCGNYPTSACGAASCYIPSGSSMWSRYYSDCSSAATDCSQTCFTWKPDPGNQPYCVQQQFR